MSDNTKLSKNPSLALNSFNKAITENEKLKLNINSNIVLEKEETLNIPNLSSQFEYIDMRGSSDSFALKIKYHNESRFNALSSVVIDQRELLMTIERLRYEYLGILDFKGIRINILKKWFKQKEIIQKKKTLLNQIYFIPHY